MANHKSAKKRIRQNETRRVTNKWKTSRLRTEIKKLKVLVTEAKKDDAQKQLTLVQSLFARLAKTSAIRKDTAGRKTGRLANLVNKI